MCLSHVCIFLNRRVRTLNVTMIVIMSLCIFDVPKLVRSPRCDHRHDEESRNGRDIKIHILEAYLDIGSVPGEIGILPEYREVT